MFKAIWVEKVGEKGQKAAVTELEESQLPEGDVTVKVEFSTLNYKDGLAITGTSPVLRAFPMIPGIDLAGVVEESSHADYKKGDRVAITGNGIGEKYFGGLTQKARVKAEWLVPLPSTLSTRDAMAIGTAGFTAMLSVLALERHGVGPKATLPVLVTGANGGVGGFAIALLADLGYKVVASTGRVSEAEYLKKLGATEIIDRSELSAPGKPLGKERWSAVVDSVGSHTLANACATTQTAGVVAACGLAQGMDFPATVAPFILRGVALIGIDSVNCPRALRLEAWKRLGEAVKPSWFEAIAGRTISLDQVPSVAAEILEGKIRGRVVVDANA